MKKHPPANQFRCGAVSIIGRPNTGKSTLLNCLVKEKLAIVSAVAQTTRYRIRGIYNEERGQIIFIDTPGLHLGKDRLDKLMNTSSLDSIQTADCIIHLVDTSRPTGKEEQMVVENLKGVKVPVILGLNKIDLKGRYVPEYIDLWERIKGRPCTEMVQGRPVTELDSLVILPLSATKGINIERLLDLLFERLPKGETLYPRDTLSDVPQKLMMADVIREKLFNLLREEIPHSLAVAIEEMTPRKKNVLYLRAVILVERESQKEIVIGKKGEVLKQAGSLARRELEEILEKKIFLELYVRFQKGWRNNEMVLQELGYPL